MHARVKTLIETLQLQPHPEGGWYRETFRSPHPVRREADGAVRSGLTTIFFLLAGDGISRGIACARTRPGTTTKVTRSSC